jgi:hypothetical protein
VVHASCGLLDELGLPAPVHAAAHIAGQALTGVARVGSFLDSLRQSASQRDRR